ncbi:hypothetical protein WICMUC_001339 [Wickerhamomyces mucosus]|uniref:Deacetylase sirtuin-type domain-containing protein n=1 Tax=Wickerhamomyces mucosus TaxID=1378264 RepID=A0A9P8PV97_9ASCO|nr:hypothetical protein WICMUC_001339 [Wickerhamomyces mucosus]
MMMITPPSSQEVIDLTSDCESDIEITQIIENIVEIYDSPPSPPTSESDSDSKCKPKTNPYKPKRKPKLKYRPPNGTLLNIETYDSSLPIENQDDDIDNEDVGFLHYALKYSKRIAVITGAGISVASGIPDFRSSNGLFQGIKSTTTTGSSGKALFESDVYRSEQSTAEFHAMINQLHEMTQNSEPTKFHRMLNTISEEDRLLRLYTQNIDCLETTLPHLRTTVPIMNKPPYPPTIQLHGTINYMYCAKCNWNSELEPGLFSDHQPPACPECLKLDETRRNDNKRSQGIGCLRPRIVLYNEFHPDGEKIGQISSTDLRSKPDCLIIAGTSLKIPGVKRLVKELARAVHAANGCIIWINIEQPNMSIVDSIEHLDLIVTGDCQDIPSIIENYDDQLRNTKGKRNYKRQTPSPISSASSPKKTQRSGYLSAPQSPQKKDSKFAKNKQIKGRVIKPETQNLIHKRLQSLTDRVQSVNTGVKSRKGLKPAFDN